MLSSTFLRMRGVASGLWGGRARLSDTRSRRGVTSPQRYSPGVYESQLLSRLQSRRLTYFGFEVLSFDSLTRYLPSSSFNCEKPKVMLCRDSTVTWAEK